MAQECYFPQETEAGVAVELGFVVVLLLPRNEESKVLAKESK